MKFSPCLEWLFADEAEVFTDRIALAKQAGFATFEFWRTSNKDVDAIAAAAMAYDIAVTGFVAEPMIALTDPANHERFLAGLRDSTALAQRLGAGVLIAQAGNDLPGRTRDEQRRALVTCLTAAASILKGTGVRLGLEPLNTLIDHKGYYLHSTAEALDIVDEIGAPEIRLTYDIYHAAVMGESTSDILAGRVDRVAHVHVADHPGRGAPGTGGVDLRERVEWLVANGYDGPIGLEYKPQGGTRRTLEAVMAQFAAS